MTEPALAATPPSQEPHRYNYVVAPEEQNHVAPIITRFVGRDKLVLEVGAGPGAITRYMKEQAGCAVTAVEIDADALPYLTPHCERVFQRDLNNPRWMDGLSVPEGYDVIVAADVLEHLNDPWQALSAMKNLLAPGGYVVASLPHVGHNAVLAALLCGDFRYHKWGLLDRTHLRFFGLKNIESLFVQAGYAIADYDYVLHPPETTELGDLWGRLPKRTRKLLARSAQGEIYQVVVQARPGEARDSDARWLLLPVPEPDPRILALKAWLKPLLPAPVRNVLRHVLTALKINV